jgi:hypothetical protein
LQNVQSNIVAEYQEAAAIVWSIPKQREKDVKQVDARIR